MELFYLQKRIAFNPRFIVQNAFFTCFQTLRRLRKNVASYTKQDFSAISFPNPTLPTVECSLRFPR